MAIIAIRMEAAKRVEQAIITLEEQKSIRADEISFPFAPMTVPTICGGPELAALLSVLGVVWTPAGVVHS